MSIEKMHRTIRCIALDLDRTTLNSKGVLSDGNRKVLEAAIQQGVQVVIASGRPFGSLPEDVLSIPGIAYAITSNGAAVYHIPTGECIQRFVLTEESVEQILHLTQKEPIVYEAFIRGIAYAQEEYVKDPVSYGATDQGVPYIQKTRKPRKNMAEFLREHRGELDAVDLVVRDDETKDRLSGMLLRTVPDIYVTSSVRQLIEISHRDAGKHSGLRFLSGRLGIPRESIAAFGDGDNDADMLQYAGIGIAVANASKQCITSADYVTKHHDEDGVAWAIHRLLSPGTQEQNHRKDR